MDFSVAAGLSTIVILVVLILLRVPIAVSLLVTSAIGLTLVSGWDAAFITIGRLAYSKVASWSLLTVPLFIIMGDFAYHAGVVENLVDAVSRWTARLPAGLGIATFIACAFFGACSGSSMAAVATFGRTVYPEMTKAGYNPKFTAGVISSAALLAVMIPPSIMMIIYAMSVGVSIGAMLIAGFLPGIVTLVVYTTGTLLLVKARPSLAPTSSGASSMGKVRSLRHLWPVLILSGIIIGGIYSGTFTAIEAGAIAATAALVMLPILKRRKSLPGLLAALRDGGRTTSLVFFIVVGSMIYSFFLAVSGTSAWMSNIILNLGLPPVAILIVSLAILIPLGMIIDAISMLLITMPIIFPIVSALGFNAIWFGVLVVKLSEIAMITPPIGVNLFVMTAVASPKLPFEDVAKGVAPFIAMELVTLAILFIFPNISLVLPRLAGLIY